MKRKTPIITDEFLDEVAEELNRLYGEPPSGRKFSTDDHQEGTITRGDGYPFSRK
ncbi:MAG: hypothetical protein ACO1OC_09830 [Tuberibacillus sp.]